MFVAPSTHLQRPFDAVFRLCKRDGQRVSDHPLRSAACDHSKANPASLTILAPITRLKIIAGGKIPVIHGGNRVPLRRGALPSKRDGNLEREGNLAALD